MQHDNPEILSESRAAEFLGKTARTLANWRALRQGPPFVKIGRSVAYRRAALVAWIEAQERACDAPRGRPKRVALRGDRKAA